MPWYAIALIVYLVLNCGLVIGRVGVPRKPLTGSEAVATIVLSALIIWCVAGLAAS